VFVICVGRPRKPRHISSVHVELPGLYGLSVKSGSD